MIFRMAWPSGWSRAVCKENPGSEVDGRGRAGADWGSWGRKEHCHLGVEESMASPLGSRAELSCLSFLCL